jgi:phosphoglycolate phosphatase-like HAD superfamily hydrolase
LQACYGWPIKSYQQGRKQMAYVIFDLDGTVIDSSHRQNTLPDGSLDLANWIANNTPDMIARDSLLPLARIMSILSKTATIVVCTARAYQPADEAFLAANGLKYDAYLSRGAVGDMRPDAELKIDLLNDYFKKQGFLTVAEAKPMMFDDNLKVIDAMTKLGVTCYNAVEANKRLARRA